MIISSIDPSPLGHAAGFGEERIVNGIGEDIGIAILEIDVDHDKVVYVIQVVTNLVCGELAVSASDNKIAAGSVCDLERHMWRYIELAIIPRECELQQ